MEDFFVAITKNRLSEHFGLLVIVAAASFVNVDTLILFLVQIVLKNAQLDVDVVYAIRIQGDQYVLIVILFICILIK